MADHRARDALRRRGQQPVVILLDAKMPHLDGRGFLHAYRDTPEPYAPVIVITADRPADAGDWPDAAAVVPKPFDLDERLRLVAAHAGTD